MSLSDVAVPADPRSVATRVNDLSIQVATVNGSGSQTANLVLLRSLFQMGVPVSGKNMFPSNIAGLPTWYTIRANKHGYIARKKEVDFLVAMNPETGSVYVTEFGNNRIQVFDSSGTFITIWICRHRQRPVCQSVWRCREPVKGQCVCVRHRQQPHPGVFPGPLT